MVDIAAITGAVSGALGVLKDVVTLAKKAENHELNEKVADLQGRFLDIQMQLIDLTNENQNLKQQVSERERETEIGKDLVYQESVYWLRKPEGRDGPYCPNCWDAQRKLIRLIPGATRGTYSCGVCKQGGFRTSEFHWPKQRVLSSGGSDMSGY